MFYGVPKAVGAVWRATRAPSLILLAGFVGVPVLLAVVITTDFVAYRSRVAADLITVGMMRAILLLVPTVPLPPNTAAVWEGLTPSQREVTNAVAVGIGFFYVVMFVTLIWWIRRFMNFVGRQSSKRPTS